MFTIEGTMTAILPVIEGDSQRGHWVKGGFAIQFGSEYPRKAAFSAFGTDLVAQIGTLYPGQRVQVSFTPESREYNGKWYTDLRCIGITAFQAVQPVQQPAQPAPQTAAYQPGIQPQPMMQPTPAAQYATEPPAVQASEPVYLQENESDELPF